VNAIQKVARWALEKATGFPVWGAAGPWPSCVVEGLSGGTYAAEQLSTVYGCMRVRGQTMGSLPCRVYRVAKDGHKELAPDHWLWPLVNVAANEYLSNFEFFENMEKSFCLWGNAYAYIARLGGRVVALNFLNPDFVVPRWDYLKDQLTYNYSFGGKLQEFSPKEILHVKNMSSNGGWWGDSPIRSYAIKHASAAQDYGTYFLQNMGRPSGYLKFKGKRPANEEANNRLRNDWQGIHGGPANAGKTGVLWESGEYVPISVAPEEAQYIETMRFTVEEIAGAIYGVPLNLIGQSDKTATYASAEQFDISFTKHTVSPQCRRFEAAIRKALLAAEPDIVCEFDLEELQRGDTTAQTQNASTMVNSGIATRNEVRPKFNLPKMDGADELTVQVNQTPIDQLGKATNISKPLPPGQAPPQTPPPAGAQP